MFGSSPTFDTSGTQGYTNALNNIASSFGQQGQAAQGQYQGFNQNDVNAINNYSNYLTANPATQQYNAEQTANAANGARQAAAGATAGLDQALASRGIAPNSSMGVGGLTGIANGQASTNANAQYAQGMANQATHASNLAANTNLWNGVTQQAFGNANTLQNQQAGLNQQGFSNADQLALQSYQGQLQNQASNNALAGQLFSSGATFFGGPGGAALEGAST